MNHVSRKNPKPSSSLISSEDGRVQVGATAGIRGVTSADGITLQA